MALSNSQPPDGWRSASSASDRGGDDGFETWTSVRRRGGNGGGGTRPPHYTQSEIKPVASLSGPTVFPVAATSATNPPTSYTGWKSNRFQPLETKIVSESFEERIMSKVRAKVNKIGPSTYDATKVFMQQILDSGETEFLGEFMEFVFQKAAKEPSFCEIYARLLHELADEFGHLRTEMCRRFREYTNIFVEARETPDVGTADYTAFVESQTQKKFRRGYSQFVAELAKLGEIHPDDFRLLIFLIAKSIQESVYDEDNKLLCEELVDCFGMMCKASGKSILSKTTWWSECITNMQGVLGGAARSSTPGLSNKARFALMDLLDASRRGWRSG